MGWVLQHIGARANAMIAKELDPFVGRDKFQLAGRKAEEQMAFYLRRYFATSDDIYVLNGLKIFANGELAQIDHLIVHPNGIIIIESKSVASKITVTNDLQWIREYAENSTGMKSPIIQAEMQKMVFLEFAKKLNDIPGVFLNENIQLLIAISDNGIINWSNRDPIPSVLKADQVCNAATAIIEAAAVGKSEEIIHESALKQWFLDNTAIGVYKQIPSRNWVPWIALFLAACNEYKNDLDLLPCPDESMDKLWGNVDFQIRRQTIHELFPSAYATLWRSTVGKRQESFHKERLANMRASAYKSGAFNLSLPP